MWNILFKKDIEIQLPVNFNVGTMYPFIDKVIDEQCDAKCSELTFDFSVIRFIKPVGVVVLSNLIEYLRKTKVKVRFKGHTSNTAANIFLDDAGFFNHYLKGYVFESHSARRTTIPLELVANQNATAFLIYKVNALDWQGSWIVRKLIICNTNIYRRNIS